MTVWKFVMEDPETPIEMPKDAVILHVAAQRNEVCLWALVDPGAPKVQRRFVVVGTGHHVPPYRGPFLGTVLLHGGDLVFHIWEDLRP